MSAENESFESIFRNALEHAEMPVDPAIWQSVAGGIGGAAGGAAGGGISLFAKVAIGVIAAGGVTTAAVFLTADEEQPAEQAPVVVASTPDENKALVTDSIDWKDVVQDEASAVESSETTPTLPSDTPAIPVIDDSEFEQPEATEGVTEDVTEATEISATDPGDDANERPTYPMDRGGTPTTDPVPEPVQPDDLLQADFTAYALDKNEMQYRFAASYGQAQLYFWQVDDEYAGNLGDLVYMFKEEGEHDVSLTVQDASGQEKQHRIVFTVERPIVCVPEIPNVFTPNNDGYNDVLDIEELSMDCTIMEFRVFDVLGALVFEASESIKTWDGYDPYGNRCPVGVYRVEYVLTGNDGKTHPGQQYVNLK